LNANHQVPRRLTAFNVIIGLRISWCYWI